MSEMEKECEESERECVRIGVTARMSVKERERYIERKGERQREGE